MTFDPQDPYVRAASPLQLLVQDADLLIRQFDSSRGDPRMPLTVEERRAWLEEAEAVLRAMSRHGMAPECLAIADRRGRLQTLAERRQWAKEARDALCACNAAVRAGPPSSTAYADNAAWNVMMRAGSRLVTFKVAGHAPRTWSHVEPPTEPGGRRAR